VLNVAEVEGVVVVRGTTPGYPGYGWVYTNVPRINNYLTNRTSPFPQGTLAKEISFYDHVTGTAECAILYTHDVVFAVFAIIHTYIHTYIIVYLRLTIHNT
jgi:hypothetical protein